MKTIYTFVLTGLCLLTAPQAAAAKQHHAKTAHDTAQTGVCRMPAAQPDEGFAVSADRGNVAAAETESYRDEYMRKRSMQK